MRGIPEKASCGNKKEKCQNVTQAGSVARRPEESKEYQGIDWGILQEINAVGKQWDRVKPACKIELDKKIGEIDGLRRKEWVKNYEKLIRDEMNKIDYFNL